MVTMTNYKDGGLIINIKSWMTQPSENPHVFAPLEKKARNNHGSI